MSVEYFLTLINSRLGDKSTPEKYHTKTQAVGKVTIDEMAEEIAYTTSLMGSDVLNIFRAMIRQMCQFSAGKFIIAHIQVGLGKRMKVATRVDGQIYIRIPSRKKATFESSYEFGRESTGGEGDCFDSKG